MLEYFQLIQKETLNQNFHCKFYQKDLCADKHFYSGHQSHTELNRQNSFHGNSLKIIL